MAIVRTALTDDNGTGTTGTVLNNAWQTALYDAIDARWTLYKPTTTGTQPGFSTVTGGQEADYIVFDNASLLTLQGIVPPASPTKPGKRLILVAKNAQVDLVNESGSATSSTYRITTHATANISLAAGWGTAILVYDTDSSRWRVVHHNQGAAIAYTPAWTNSGTANTTTGATLTGSYYMRANVVDYAISLRFGVGTAGGSGTYFFSLPFTSSGTSQDSMGRVTDASPANTYSVTTVLYSTTTVTGATGSPQALLTNSSPITFTNGDTIVLQGRYFTA